MAAEQGRLIELRGQRFGDLTVLKRCYPWHAPTTHASRQALWLCRCKCGAERVVLSQSLRRHKYICQGCRQ